MEATEGMFAEIGDQECRELLASRTIGRVAWTSPTGPIVLPITYTLDGDLIVFRTSPTSVLSNLASDYRVAFEIDDFDEVAMTGWSVLVRGVCSEIGVERLNPLPKPWAPGARNLVLGISPYRVTGRRVAARSWAPAPSTRSDHD